MSRRARSRLRHWLCFLASAGVPREVVEEQRPLSKASAAQAPLRTALAASEEKAECPGVRPVGAAPATPLGNWAKEAFGLGRNHYDRVGHVALGVFPVFLARELLLYTSPLRRGKWLASLSVSLVFSFAAFWELLEWWVTLLVASDVGQAFLGSQGDVWDAQWDMLLALIGAALSLLVGSSLHDRSIERTPSPR